MSEILASLKNSFNELAYEDFIEGIQFHFSVDLPKNLNLELEHTVPPSNLITFSLIDFNLSKEVVFKIYNNIKENRSLPRTLEELAKDIEKELKLIGEHNVNVN